MFEFKLPDLGEGIHEGEILQWHVAAGDDVAEDAPLVDVETDKAAVTIPSPRAGKVATLNGAVGDVVATGQVIVVIDDGTGAAAAPAAPSRAAEEMPVGLPEEEEAPAKPVAAPAAVPAAAPAAAPAAPAPPGEGRPVPAAPATEGGSLDAALNGKVSATLTDGGAVLGVGEDFAGEWAFVYAYSEPTPLGWHQVSANGTVTVPTADLAGGDHRLAVLDADGKPPGCNQVTPTGEAVPAPAAPAPQVAPAADAGPGVGVWALGGAVLLVGAGLVVVLLRRRRTA